MESKDPADVTRRRRTDHECPPIRFSQVGYVLLGIAGGLVLLDRFFGYSSGWMQYIVAMQAIEKAREILPRALDQGEKYRVFLSSDR